MRAGQSKVYWGIVALKKILVAPIQELADMPKETTFLYEHEISRPING